MKKRYRDKALLGLFASLQSADFDERENALFQAALLQATRCPPMTRRACHASCGGCGWARRSKSRSLTGWRS